MCVHMSAHSDWVGVRVVMNVFLQRPALTSLPGLSLSILRKPLVPNYTLLYAVKLLYLDSLY